MYVCARVCVSLCKAEATNEYVTLISDGNGLLRVAIAANNLVYVSPPSE